jgi:uncharacterized protein (TIGR03435 family)
MSVFLARLVVVVLPVLIFIHPLGLLGQASNSTDKRPAFDVASLKPAPLPSGRITVDLGNSAHGRLTLTNVTLSECLRFVFKIYTDEQIVGPDWIKDHRILFNIVAQASEDTPRDTLRQMALTLLTERFQLALHHESRELRYLALVVDKSGVKMHETKEGPPVGREIVRPGHISYQHVSGQTLAVLLTRFSEQPILDMTGLKGQYDVDLQWTPDTVNGKPAAVREQLGLKLEPKKGPLDTVVVDHAERIPIGN